VTALIDTDLLRSAQSTLTAAVVPLSPPAADGPRQLRGYQIEAADAVSTAHERGVEGPAVVLPTGSGKTTVIAELVRREVIRENRVLLVAHRNELIEQMADATIAVNPTGPTPAMIGDTHRGDPNTQIVSATVQSLQRQTALARLGRRDLVIVDEAHHAVAATYRKVLEHFAGLGARRAGFTATMTRLAPTKAEPALRSVWAEVVFEKDILWAIENGFLLAPEGVTVDPPDLDVSALHTGAGDITDHEAAKAMMRDTTLNATVQAVIGRTGGVSTITFGASTEHCRQLTGALIELGDTAETVVGTTKVRERTGIYRRFRNGTTRVLVTVDVLTEGADFPRCEAVVLARPTHSQSRLVQCVGRALRPHTFECGRGKERALIVDLVGAGSLGLIIKTKLDVEHRKDRGEEDGLGCGCVQPCSGEHCDLTCTGVGCDCACLCAGAQPESDASDPAASTALCTCMCTLTFGVCRCGCECDLHRVDQLETFDPVTGERMAPGTRRRTDSPWSQRTATIRWTAHPRGLVRPVFQQNGSKGVLMLADMRGVAGSAPGRDWAFGFYDTSVRQMFWVGLDGRWQQPGPHCHLQGFSLSDADALAQKIFGGHMRDVERRAASDAQVDLAAALGVPDAQSLDRRDLSDMLALAQADLWMPQFNRPAGDHETAA
jgi:superfamily II DNA or RNA helicase